MQVVGITTQQEVYGVSDKSPFKISQILVIEDKRQKMLLGEVTETSAYNRYLPLNMESSLIEASLLESLKRLGYSIEDETLYLCKIRLLEEADYPVETGSAIRYPIFPEVEKLLLRCAPEEGLTLGSIKSTEELYPTAPNKLRDIFHLFKEGRLLEQSTIPYIFDIKSMQQYPHIGIFGGSGSGKSFGLRVILEELMKLQLPTVVIDPHYEMDFSEKSEIGEDFKERFTCLTIGRHIGVRFERLTDRELISIVGAATSGNLTDPMRAVIQNLYKKNDTYSTFSFRINLLKEAMDIGSENKIQDKLRKCDNAQEKERLEEALELYQKHGDLPSSSVSGVIWRLNKLYHDGLFSNDIIPVEQSISEGKLVVIQGPMKLLNVFSTYLISNLYYKRRDYKDAQFRGEKGSFFPPFILVADESHNFAPKGYDSSSKGIIKEIAQEGRKYGVFLLLATQRPALLDETITAQLNTKIVFRTVRASDIETIKEETDISSQEAKRLPYLPSGDAFVSSAITGRTTSIRVRMSKTISPHQENPFEEWSSYRSSREDSFFEMIKKVLPLMPTELLKATKELNMAGVNINVEELVERLDKLCENNKITKRRTPFGDQYMV